MSRQDEIEERRRKRILAWGRKMEREGKRLVLSVEQRLQLMREGLIDEDSHLTAKGELVLHQLNLLEWMIRHPRKKKEVSSED